MREPSKYPLAIIEGAANDVAVPSASNKALLDALKIPAHIEPIVDVLGCDMTVQFLLTFGGAMLYLPDTIPRSGHMLVDLVGHENAIALGKKIGSGHIRVPLAKPFIIQYLFAKGETIADISRALHTTHNTVARHLNANDRAERAKQQISFKF